MIIANPLYDVTFKRMLENNRVAKFFIGTILDCEVLTLVPETQEYIFTDEIKDAVTLLRKDFSATIMIKGEGEKKVLIELQKAKRLSDVYRFRKYLGSEYIKSKLPLISIYILGFDLSVSSSAFMARPDCYCLLTQKVIDINDDFVQKLTHTAYFIQTLKIKPSYNTRLEKLLTLFEQANFMDSGTTTKGISFPEIEPEFKELIDELQYVAGDSKLRKELESEQYYSGAIDEMFGEKDKELASNKIIMENNKKELEQNKKELEQNKKALINSAKELLKAGLSVELISEITGLDIDEFER